MNILEEANQITAGDRNKDYGHPSVDFGRTAKMWSAILGVDVVASDVALCMIVLKVSREVNGHKRDNLVDIAGYARTMEMLTDLD